MKCGGHFFATDKRVVCLVGGRVLACMRLHPCANIHTLVNVQTSVEVIFFSPLVNICLHGSIPASASISAQIVTKNACIHLFSLYYRWHMLSTKHRPPSLTVSASLQKLLPPPERRCTVCRARTMKVTPEGDEGCGGRI